MTAREKVVSVERQVLAMVDSGGIVTKFTCPFCSQSTQFGEFEENVLCCPEAAEVVEAVLKQIEFKDNMETVERVMDAFAGRQHSALVN